MKFKSIINDVCCDSRIKDGVLRIDNPEHVFVLQEYLEKAGYSIEDIVNKTSRLFEAGRFPERQAYNKDGILVTFPSKEYRDRAVRKGTHFAENPKKADATLFAPTDVGGLSTSDIPIDNADKKEPTDSVSLDQELKDKISGEEKSDNRTPTEKSQDSVAVQSILTGESPLINYSVEEAKRYGFYNKGMDWFDQDGNYIGEQIYDEVKQCSKIIKEINSSGCSNICDAKKMEKWIAAEFKSEGSSKVCASIGIANYLKSQKYIGAKDKGAETCQITNPIFKEINETSKTDLILATSTEVHRVSLKEGSSWQACSAQNDEINSILTAVMPTMEGIDVEDMKDKITNFITHGLKREYYELLTSDVQTELGKLLSKVIESPNITDRIAGIASKVGSIISRDEESIENLVTEKTNEIENDLQERMQEIKQLKEDGKIDELIEKERARQMKKRNPSEFNIKRPAQVTTDKQAEFLLNKLLNQIANFVKSLKRHDKGSAVNYNPSEQEMINVLTTLNLMFVGENKKKILYEMLTGKQRFVTGQSDFSSECIATHMMSWECNPPKCSIYTIDEFVNDNINNIKFRFRSRGSGRGISIRSDYIKGSKSKVLKEDIQQLEELFGIDFKKHFEDAWEFIKMFTGKLKDLFVKLFNIIKFYLKEIWIEISDFCLKIKDLVKLSWNSFLDAIQVGAEGEPGSGWKIRNATGEPLQSTEKPLQSTQENPPTSS